MDISVDWKAQGNAAFSAKDFPKAVECFTEALKLSPNDHVLYSNRSGAYASMNKFDLAISDASKCIELNPQFVKGFSRKGLAQLQLGDVTGAADTYRQGLRLEPTNEALLVGLREAEKRDPTLVAKARVIATLQLLMKTPKFKAYCEEDASYESKLTTILEEIVKDAQNLPLALQMCTDPRIKEALTVILGLPEPEVDEDEEREKQRAKARAAREEQRKGQAAAREKTPAEIEGDKWKEKGNELYKARKFDEALAAYDMAIKANPTNITYHTNKAAVYLEMGNFAACLQECSDALERRYEIKATYEDVAKVYNRMAVCYKRTDDLANAIRMYEKSLMEDNNRHTRAALADLKRLKEKRDQEAYQDPEIADQHRVLGNDFFKRSNFPEAKKEYDEAIKRNPTDARLYANRSAALMKLLDLPASLKDAEKSLELDPTVAKVWARKGNICSLMKDYNKAMTAYQKGLDVDSSSAECQQGLSNVLHKVQESTYCNQVDEDQVKHAMADPEIQALLSDPQFRLTLGSLQENPAKLMEALKDPAVAKGLQKLMAAGILKMS